MDNRGKIICSFHKGKIRENPQYEETFEICYYNEMT